MLLPIDIDLICDELIALLEYLINIINHKRYIMERRNFLQSTAFFSLLGLQSSSVLNNLSETTEPIKPFLLPSQPPLAHNNGMDIRVWVRNGATSGLFSSIECAVAPKLMGPAPHAHKELDELMYVLEGTASVLLGDEVVEIQAGGWHMICISISHLKNIWRLYFIDSHQKMAIQAGLKKEVLK